MVDAVLGMAEEEKHDHEALNLAHLTLWQGLTVAQTN